MSARHFSYSPTTSAVIKRCAKLRSTVRSRGLDVAAFHIPARLVVRMEHEAMHELRGLTLFGVPCTAHNGSGGIFAETGRRLSQLRYELVFGGFDG